VCHSEVVSEGAFDLSTTHVHLGRDSTAVAVSDFEWTREFLAGYEAEFAADGSEGRLVMIGASDTSWNFWERHPAGEELVCVIAGRITLVQDINGSERHIALEPGHAAINPRGVWHTTDVHEPGRVLFVTPGLGTEHRPR
jgi:quercetin dioxygenase-like cupin family protein